MANFGIPKLTIFQSLQAFSAATRLDSRFPGRDIGEKLAAS